MTGKMWQNIKDNRIPEGYGIIYAHHLNIFEAYYRKNDLGLGDFSSREEAIQACLDHKLSLSSDK